MNELDSILTSEEYARNPHPFNHRLRAEDPVHWSDAWEQWVPTRYDDIRGILDDYARFSSTEVSAIRVKRLLERAVPEPERSQLLEFWEFGGLFQADPPIYRRYRALMMKAFMPRLNGIEARVQQLVDQFMAPGLEAGSMDIVRDVAYPLPEMIIFELLGVDTEYRHAFTSWASSIVLAIADQSGKAAMESARALGDAYGWVRDVVRDRRQDPREDIISVLVNDDGEFAAMNERDLLATFVLVLLAGHETTANLIASGMYHLLRNPELLRSLNNDSSLLESAVEEFLRYDSPIQVTARRALVDVQVGDRTIREGDIVAIMHGAANRDPARFDDPDTLDIRRAPNPHVAFGHGVHFCVGAPLARIEGPIAIRTMVRLIADAEIQGEPVWRANTTFRGLESLPVAFRPRAAASRSPASDRVATS